MGLFQFLEQGISSFFMVYFDSNTLALTQYLIDLGVLGGLGVKKGFRGCCIQGLHMLITAAIDGFEEFTAER